MPTDNKILFYSTSVIVGAYFLFMGLAKAKGFLAPLVTAVILSLVILPLARLMESKMKRVYSSLLSTFLLFLVSLGFIAILSFQVKNFAEDWPTIKETMEPKVEQLKAFIAENTPLQESDLEESKGGSAIPFLDSGDAVISAFNKGFEFAGTYLLTFIYIFFLLNYRKRFKEFLLRLFPDEENDEVKKAIRESANVVQQYLGGKLILIALLAVLYSIGLGLSGVSNFILISILAAVFTLIPYIGNIIGFLLAMIFGYLSSGELTTLIGILLTFTVTQFVESYLLQPYIVGDKVDLHPFFVILIVVVGNALWGVIGMILAIPVLAIITIIFLQVKPLHPFGFLFSNKSISD